uniref:Serpentine receptor class gamma n=1 Tax=Panagrellus redivivus TaxID=6233 RepID=A0A7E4ZVF4_PANRE
MVTEDEFKTVSSLVTLGVTVFSVLVSCPLYILVIVLVYRRRRSPPFDSHFFTIFIALGVFDLLSYGAYLIKKLPYFGVDWSLLRPYNEGHVTLNIIYFFIWMFAFAQFQLTILISFNRFASIVLRGFYSKYWTHRLTGFIFIGIIFCSACIATPVFFVPIVVTSKETVLNVSAID